MDKLINVLRNDGKTIRHVHCCAFDASGNHLSLKREITRRIEDDKTYVAVATCKLANTLPLLLHDLGEKFNIKKDECKNISTFMESMDKTMCQNTKERLIIAIFGAEDLHSIGFSELTAFFAIPSSFEFCRILTVGDSPWNFCEFTESLTGLQPVEIFIQEPIEKIEKDVIAEISEKTKLDKQFVKLIFQSVSAHIQDKNLIKKICMKAHNLQTKEDFCTERERIVFLGKSIPRIMNEFESKTLLKQQKDEISQKVLELPVLDQLLLLSTFCATHNSVAGDKRFFVKHHGREQRNENRERAIELAADQKENGPKAADIQRIYFIFQVFLQKYKDELEEKRHIRLETELFDPLPQLASLENTSLISRVSSYANLDQAKVKCLISMENAKNIASNIGIKLEEYLERPI